MNDSNISPTEGEVQNAIVEVASKKIIELTQSNILLEANLIACQKRSKLLLGSIEDLKDNFTESTQIKDSEADKIKKKYDEDMKKLEDMELKYHKLTTQHTDLVNKVDTVYKPQLKDLQTENKKLQKE